MPTDAYGNSAGTAMAGSIPFIGAFTGPVSKMWAADGGADIADNPSEAEGLATSAKAKARIDKANEEYFRATGIMPGGYGTQGQLESDPYGRGYRDSLTAAMMGLGQRKPLSMADYGPLATMSGPAQVQATKLARADEMAMRGKQLELANMLGLAAKGEGPSIAGMQMQANTEQALAANRAAAAGLGRVNAGLAMRSLGQQQSAALGQAAMGSAMLKMQEAQQAQASLGGLLGGIRAADFSAASRQAELDAAQRMANAGFSQQTSMANMDAANRYEAAKAQYGLGKAGMSMQDQAQRDSLMQWIMGQQFAQNQADRDAKLRAWAAQKGVGLQQQGLDWQKEQADRLASAQQWAATAGMVGKGAEMMGNWYGQAGQGSAGSSAFDKFMSGSK